MKKVNLFSMVTALLLAATSCSDDIDNGGNKPGEPIDGNGVYLTVNIMTPSAGGANTKATPTGGEDGDGYLEALTNENKVNNVTVILYGPATPTQDGTAIKGLDINSSGMKVYASAYGTVTGEGPDGEYEHHKHKRATVALDSKLLTKGDWYRILTVVNADVTGSFQPGKNLSDCLSNMVSQHKTSDSNFIMSTHVEKNKPTGATEDVHSIVSFDGTETDKNNPKTATVWVERLSARIDYVGDTFKFDVEGKDIAGTDRTVASVDLLGLYPVNVAKHPMYIFKLLTEDGTIDNPLKALIKEEKDTNGAGTNYVIEPTTAGRSATANNPKQFVNAYDDGWISTATDYKEFTADFIAADLTDKDSKSIAKRIITYAGENTMKAELQNHGNTTGVIFKATYTPTYLIKYNEADGKLVGDEVSNYAKGFYLVDNVIYEDLAAAEADYIITGMELETDPLVILRKNFTKNDWSGLGWTLDALKTAVNAIDGKKDLGYLKFLSGKLETATELDATTMNWAAFIGSRIADESDDMTSAIANATEQANHVLSTPETTTIEYYGTDHICYYPYWIRHANNDDPKVSGIMEFCIVRNNVYQLAVSGVSGLGMIEPFDDKDDPNEGEDEKYYLQVQLYVRDWVVRDNEGIILKK